MNEENPKLKVGILGCGPIAQFAHFEACQKAKNVELYAICDAAQDLAQKMAGIWHPAKVYHDYQKMLDDSELDAIIIAVSDTFHVPLSLMAVQAGKHVLVEKPLSHSVDECLALIEKAHACKVLVQVGHMKRFDPGISYAQEFIEKKLGELIALKAWYGDNTQRYTATDNLQPLPIKSQQAVKPNFNEKENLERYYMMAHGSHLIDTAIFLGGKIGSVQAKLRKVANAYCWFIDTEFKNGALGHLDLTMKIRADWHEGFHVYGIGGSVFAKTHNPWYYKTSEVQCFLEEEQLYYSPLGADGFSYRQQLEHFAEVILKGKKLKGTSLAQGLEVVKGMIAIHKSVQENKRIYLEDIKSGAL